MNIEYEYLNLLNYILKNGYPKSDRTGTGTISIFGTMLTHDFKHGFPILTSKKIHIKSVIHELLWFLNGDTNIKYLNDNNVKIWNEWADENGNLGKIYGHQWTNWNDLNINQIENIINQLKNNPDSRRIMVNAWNVGQLDQMNLPPCHFNYQFWTRDLTLDERLDILVNEYGVCLTEHHRQYRESLCDTYEIPKKGVSLLWNQRSADIFLGVPFNIASYGFLLYMIAQQVNMVPLELKGVLGDTHIYNNHVKQVKTQLNRLPNDLPYLKLNKANSIFEYKYEDFELKNYNPQPPIKAPIAV